MKETATEPVIDASSLDQAPDMFFFFFYLGCRIFISPTCFRYGDDDVVSLLELKRPFEFKIIAVRNVYDLGQRKIGNGDFLTAASTQLYCEVIFFYFLPIFLKAKPKINRFSIKT